MYTKKQLAECAYRELEKRKSFYPRMVVERKMSQAQADQQIDMMQAIYRVLINLGDKDIECQLR